jgi:hypothetical protein
MLPVLIVVCASTADDDNKQEAARNITQNRALAREHLKLSIANLPFSFRMTATESLLINQPESNQL